MERESTIYIIALYLKHTDFIRAKRQTNVPLKNAQYTILQPSRGGSGVAVPVSTSLAPLTSS